MTRQLMLIFLAIAALQSSLLVAQHHDQASGLDAFGRPAWIDTPKLPAPDTTTPDEAHLRIVRSKMFDVPGAKPLIAHDVSDKSKISGGGFDEIPQGASIPAAMSDVVVVASVVSFQPFLSNDRSMVYSELSAVPVEVIKDPANLLGTKTKFILLQRGGTLMMGNGKVVNAVPYGGSNPVQLKTRYLLFLRFEERAQAYIVLRAWDLSGNRPREMDGDGHFYNERTEAENSFRTEADLKSYIRAH